MIARFLRVIIAIAPRILGRWLIRDIHPSHPNPTPTIFIIPVTIAAYPRQYPQVTTPRGKGFVITSSPLGTQMGGGTSDSSIFTARHVISDNELVYRMDKNIELTTLSDLGDDVGRAGYSGSVSTGDLYRVSDTGSGKVLMAQYRDSIRSWLTGNIISEQSGEIIVDLAVQAGDSGSPVILPNQKIGIVSQSHSGDQAIVKFIK